MAFIETNNIKGDVFGGITAGIVALPLALAFGIQAFSGIDSPEASSMGALAGLVGATLLGFFAALFGGTHSQISGPTGPMTVITASIVSGAWASSQGNISAVILSMSLAGIFCGLFQVIFGLIRIGKYVRYIPYPVLSGFMSGIGVIIILQQIYPIIGKKSPASTLDMIINFPAALADGVSVIALALGLACISLIVLVPKVTKKVPATLVALIAVTVVSLFTNLDSSLTIGNIPAGLPMPFFTKVQLDGIDWASVLEASLVPGLTLAGLGSIDTLLTSVVADNITKTKHNSNQELIGQGIGNAVAGLFCGLAGAGATMRTVVNVKSGGRTQISGMIHAVLLLAILLGLGSLVKYVPLSVLAGILITVGWGIIDFRGFKDILRIPKSDAFVMMVVFLMTVFVDLLTAVGIGMVIACVLFMKRAGDLVENSYSAKALDTFDKESPWEDEKDIPEEIRNRIYIERLDGPIFFGSITGFQRVMHDIPTNLKIVIIRMRRVPFMDQSGVYAMETAIKDLQAQGIKVLMTIIQPQPRYMLEKHHIIPILIPKENTFETFEECTEYLKGL
ncbi:MAG: SulP family inorganic anion transporter [Prevotella sp.]|nr:SulP family inorganic anion transporter [Prevotella sp.]MCI6369531.1 SulP family inorganic anion transporter [Prevotella sp.]MCI6804181.1 SulP family inorganic anion transporter [Prevotella sp.]MCI7452943.1 SulP family inorganic anion transporter [Prevotella sp.]MCI7496745.1 SulP family inorganic anion transporter [Prevotella sp.]